MGREKKDKKPIPSGKIIETRLDTKFTLRVKLSSTSSDPICLLIPRTYSVRQPAESDTQQTPSTPVQFRLSVHGVSCPPERPWDVVCRSCKKREYNRRNNNRNFTEGELAGLPDVQLVDFDAPEQSIVLQNGSTDIDFRFRCYPGHLSSSGFRYVLFTDKPICLLYSRITAELYEDDKKTMSCEVGITFKLQPRAQWKVCDAEEIHQQDADLRGEGTSIDAICILIVVSLLS
jgi:hypothetical protein